MINQDDGSQSICHQIFVSKKKTTGTIEMAFRDVCFLSFEAYVWQGIIKDLDMDLDPAFLSFGSNGV
jgi:hypothetical protein